MDEVFLGPETADVLTHAHQPSVRYAG
jgi:hypothetical protein